MHNLSQSIFFTSKGFVHDEISKGFTTYKCNYSKEHYKDSLFSDYKIPIPTQLRGANNNRLAEHFAGRYCAKSCLEFLGLKNPLIPIHSDRSPIWPNGFIGSISHTKSSAIATCTPSKGLIGVGIDIENIIDIKTINKINKLIVFDDEKNIIAPEPTEIAFTLVLSVKECFFKAAYPSVKRIFDFKDISVININSELGLVEVRTNKTLSNSIKKGMKFETKFKVTNDEQIISFCHIKNNLNRISYEGT